MNDAQELASLFVGGNRYKTPAFYSQVVLDYEPVDKNAAHPVDAASNLRSTTHCVPTLAGCLLWGNVGVLIMCRVSVAHVLASLFVQPRCFKQSIG